MPSTNAHASSATAPRPWRARPVAAISAAWLTVSNETANNMPTAATARRLQARNAPSNRRLRQPVSATVASGAVRRHVARLSRPSRASSAMEVQAPNGSSQPGAAQA